MQRDNPGSRERVIYAGNRTVTPTDVRKGHLIINTALSGAVLTMFSPHKAYRDWEFWVTNDGNSGNDVTLSGANMFIGGLGTAIVDPRKTIGYICKQDYSGTYRWMQWGDAQNLDLVSISGMASGASGSAAGISGIAQSGYDMGSGASGIIATVSGNIDTVSGIAQSGFDMGSGGSGVADGISGIAQSGYDMGSGGSGIADGISGIAQSGFNMGSGASGLVSSVATLASGASGIAAGGSGIAAGGSGIAAGASGIAAGASGLADGGSGLASATSGYADSISGIADGGSGIAAGASGIATGASGIADGGSGIAAGASGIAAGASGIAAGASGQLADISGVAQSGMDLSGIAQSGMNAYPIATGASGIATSGLDMASGASGQLHTTMSGWTPTFAWTTGDPSGVSYVARYRKDAEVCEGYLYLYGLDGSGATAVTISPPVTPQDTNARVAFACMQEISGVYIAGVTMDLDCANATPANRIFTIRNMNAWSGGMSGQLSFHFSFEV